MTRTTTTFASVAAKAAVGLGLFLVLAVSSPGLELRMTQPVQNSSSVTLPFCFEANRGQWNDSINFVARGPAYQFSVSPTEAILVIGKLTQIDSVDESPLPHLPRQPATFRSRSIRMKLIGADSNARVAGDGEQPGWVINYFIGNDPANWQTGVPTYSRVRTENVYPGIDLIHYGNQQHIEYDFLVSPNADPAIITIRFDGADALTVNTQGELVLTLGEDEIRQPAPNIYQDIEGKRKVVRGGYKLTGKNILKFELGPYDRKHQLVIDPVLSHSTYFGGNKMDIGWAVALDKEGAVYVAGETMSSGIASSGSFQTNIAGSTTLHGDAFVSGAQYLTYLGGKTTDVAFGLAVDEAGNAYIAGYTDSTNFPIRSGIFTNLSGLANIFTGVRPTDAFVAKLDASGSNLLFSTFLGGNEIDAAYGIALDSATNVYVSGYALSTNFPTRNTVRTNQNGNGDAFIAKLDIANTNLIYSALIGGTNQDTAVDIATDMAGNAYLAGYTSSTNFPLVNAVQTLLNNTTNVSTNFDAFISKIDPATDTISYSTFLGGTNNDYAYRLALDSDLSVYVTGTTFSSDFFRSNTNLPSGVATNGIAADVLAVKLNSAGARVYSTMFGGASRDEGYDIAVDSTGQAHIVGVTASTQFPTNGTSGFLRGTNSGMTDVFICALNTNGTALPFSAYLGGSKDDLAYGITLDPAGNIYIVGETASINFPITKGAAQTNMAGIRDIFFTKIVKEPTLSVNVSGSNVVVSWPVFSPEFLLQSNTNLLGTNWLNVSTSPATTNSRHEVTLVATNPPRYFRLRKPGDS